MGQKLFNGHFGWLVLWFVMRERQVSMLDHVLKRKEGVSWSKANEQSEAYSNLSLHRDAEERNEVHNEDGPEHRNIENFEEGAYERNRGGLCDCVPKLELG